MGMRINKTGKNNLAFTVELDHFPTIPFQPGIAKSVSGFAYGDDFAAKAEDSSVFDYAELFESGAAAWAGTAGRRAEGEELADVDEEKRCLVPLANSLAHASSLAGVAAQLRSAWTAGSGCPHTSNLD
jgi:hypothetical protein